MAEGGLLHLGAMAVLTGIVYLNLDKASPHPEELATRVEALRERVRLWSKTYDPEYSYEPKPGKRCPSRNYDSGVGYFLLSFSKNPACKDFPAHQRYPFAAFNFFCHPTTSFIGDGYHYILVGLLTFVSAVSYFFEIGGPIFGLEGYLINDKGLFVLYAITVFFALVFARLSRRLGTLEVTLNVMMSDLDRMKKHEDDKARAGMREEAAAASSVVRDGEAQ